jgi:hypothetical protein
MAIHKKAFLASGGFNVKLKWNEDGDIARRLQKFGKTEIDRKFLVRTSGRRYKRGIRRGIMPYVLYTLTSIRQRGAFWKNRRLVRSALTGLAVLVVLFAASTFLRPPWTAQAESPKNLVNLTIQKVIDEVQKSLNINIKK